MLFYTAYEMTYIVSSGALNSTPTNSVLSNEYATTPLHRIKIRDKCKIKNTKDQFYAVKQ